MTNDEVNRNLFDKDNNDDIEVTPKTTVNTEVVQAMKKLQASYNNNANKLSKQRLKKILQKNIWICWLTWSW